MYELADKSWGKEAQRVISNETVDLVCYRISEHVQSHGLSGIHVVLHGGEPLLAPQATVNRLTSQLREQVPRVDFIMQTNGIGLTERRLAALQECDVRIGVSIDGGREASDRHRLHADGRSSFDAVDRTLRMLGQHPDSFAGLLAVIDIRNDPIQTFDDLVGYQPPAMDLLLPHGHWSAPPPYRPPDASTPYGEWLAAVFDRWYFDPSPPTRIRLFEEIIIGILGGRSRSDQVGLSPVGVLVIDVDGSLEQLDALRSTYEGATYTGLNLADHPFDLALTHPAVVARQIGAAALSDTCRSCPAAQVCGGGHYPHRFREGEGFRNPSVYSVDLRYLIDHIFSRVKVDIPLPKDVI